MFHNGCFKGYNTCPYLWGNLMPKKSYRINRFKAIQPDLKRFPGLAPIRKPSTLIS